MFFLEAMPIMTYHTKQFVHDDIRDLSLFETLRPIKKPITYYGEPTGHHWMIDAETGERLPCGPVSDTYKVVPHAEMFGVQASMLIDSNLPTGNVTVTDTVYDEGLRVHRSILFNDLQAEVARSDDLVTCRIDVFNSVDQSWAFQVFSGAYRSLCRNTLVFGGEKAYHSKNKHTKNLSVRSLLAKSQVGLDNWTSNRETMNQWRRTPLSIERFAEFLKDTLCKKNTRVADVTDLAEADRVNTRLLGYLIHQFKAEQELGETVWTAYNALTHWSTHVNEDWTTTVERPDGTLEEVTYSTGRQTSSPHAVAKTRETRVRALLSSPAWSELVEAA
jgi:hypothetical protein